MSPFRYTCCCTHPETKKTGCWLFEGESHKTGKTLSPVYSSLSDLFDWMKGNGWESIPHGVWEARKKV
jgi:hypothetical protein